MNVEALVPEIVSPARRDHLLTYTSADALIATISHRVAEALAGVMAEAEAVCPYVTQTADFREALAEVCEPGARMVWPGGPVLFLVERASCAVWKGTSDDFERHHLAQVADYLAFLVHAHSGVDLRPAVLRVLSKARAPVIGWLAREAA